MCIAAFSWLDHPFYSLILLQNRDEYHSRPTKAVEWWEGGDILGGRDELAGGTWLACSRSGRVAFLTNVLERDVMLDAKSRGDLPVVFLKSEEGPKEFAEKLARDAHKYNGFNLVLADVVARKMVYVTNRPAGEPITIHEVSPGTHVLSNARLNSPWHKVQRLRQGFKELLQKSKGGDEAGGGLPTKEMVEKLMRDQVKADQNRLPKICSLDWEFGLSSIYVEVDTPLGCYGTRSTAIVTVEDDGKAVFYEKYLEDGIWKEKTVGYRVNKTRQ
ncbi:hypothetical protein MLD38_002176 [Melastoma candidum]|uniref:Uncharacterized protein n=1 Tax=Melastoma candidum TaxID=119954 RepID=A0ACB9SGK6_9MYRT|nr:hypothetical protein MLD38_002176 [Melastoma candidum]